MVVQPELNVMRVFWILNNLCLGAATPVTPLVDAHMAGAYFFDTEVFDMENDVLHVLHMQICETRPSLLIARPT
jgi:hypothetical protein